VRNGKEKYRTPHPQSISTNFKAEGREEMMKVTNNTEIPT